MKVRLAYTDSRLWSFVLGVYRFDDHVTFCFIFFGVTFDWEPVQ